MVPVVHKADVSDMVRVPRSHIQHFLCDLFRQRSWAADPVISASSAPSLVPIRPLVPARVVVSGISLR